MKGLRGTKVKDRKVRVVSFIGHYEKKARHRLLAPNRVYRIPAMHEGVDEFRRGPGFLFWLSWVAATFVGILIPFAWTEAIGTIFYLTLNPAWLPIVFETVLVYASVGIAQALVLLPYFKLRGSLEWLAATVVGQLLLTLLAYVGLNLLLSEGDNFVTVLFFSLWFPLLFPLVAVIVAALSQWFVLRERVDGAWRWVLANLGAVLLLGLIPQPLVLALLSALPELAETIAFALVMGIITGTMMERLMRNPGPKAVWDTGIKAAPRTPNRVFRTPAPQTQRDDSRIEQEREGGVIQMPLQEESAPQAFAPNRVFRTPAPQAFAPNRVYRTPAPETQRDERRIEQVIE